MTSEADRLTIAVSDGQVAELAATIRQHRAALKVEPPTVFPTLGTPRGPGETRTAWHPAAQPAPEISVIIPCFAAARTLERALLSVLGQNGPPREIILVDDLSTDGTLALALALAARHPAVTVLVRSINGGPAAARNDGAGVARGRFLCFLDADDAYAPDFFAACLAQLSAMPGLAAVQTGMQLEGLAQDIDPPRYALVANSLATNLMFRRQAFELIGGFPESPVFRGERGGEDIAVTRILVKYFARGWDARPLLIHRVGAGSHLARYLAGSRVEGDTVVLTQRSAEEESGLLPLAMLMHEDAFLRRIQPVPAGH